MTNRKTALFFVLSGDFCNFQSLKIDYFQELLSLTRFMNNQHSFDIHQLHFFHCFIYAHFCFGFYFWFCIKILVVAIPIGPDIVMETAIIIFIEVGMFQYPLNKILFGQQPSFDVNFEFVKDHFSILPHQSMNTCHFNVEFLIV